MAKNDVKTVYVCSECGNTQTKWSGKCKECGAWDSLEEEISAPAPAAFSKGVSVVQSTEAELISDIDLDTREEVRMNTGISEFDRT